jgi:polyferredoxin
MMRRMLARSHQSRRYFFQAFWLVVFAGLWLGRAEPRLWVGLLLAGLGSALLVKRAACSFGCPLFAVGELLWRTGARRFGRNFAPSFWFDLALRAAKYLLLAWVLLALCTDGLAAQAGSALPPAAWVALLAALLLLSLFFQLPWCRYLCPYGALLGLVALLSPLKVRRSPRHCVRCHKCSNRCPASLPVMLRTTVHSPECLACYRCVDGCPAPGALDLALPGNRPVPAWLTGMVLSGALITGLALSLVM